MLLLLLLLLLLVTCSPFYYSGPERPLSTPGVPPCAHLLPFSAQEKLLLTVLPLNRRCCLVPLCRVTTGGLHLLD